MRKLAISLALFCLPGCAVHLASNQPTLDDHLARIARLEQALVALSNRVDTIDRWAGSAEQRVKALEGK